jgi:cation:H+ antiporter
MDVIFNLVLVLVGLVMLCFGGSWLVNGGVRIAKKLRVNNLVIGMTIVAYGTSTPELAASVAAASEHGGIVIGNIVGSNIANIGMVIGIVAMMIPLFVPKTTLRRDVPLMLGVSFLLIALSFDGSLSHYDGLILLASLIGFTIFTYKDAKKTRIQISENQDDKKRDIYPKAIGFILLGFLLLGLGAYVTVDNAVILAQELGLSETLIGLTVIAIGTSLPELVTSIIAIRKGHMEIGVGNIIGSNIYNILMIMGVGASLGTILISQDVFIDYAIMVGFSASILFALKRGIVTRMMGLILTSVYVIYLSLSFLI